MIYTDPTQAAPAVRAALQRASRVLILTHINPDGDAVGSLLGAWHALRSWGIEAFPLASSDLPRYACWLPGIESVQVYRPGMPLPPFDLVLMLDTASLARVGKIYDEHAATLLAAPVLIVDHHVTNDGADGINLINPGSASTCELLYRLFCALELPISSETASCLLLGVVTDTQSFQTSATRPASLRVAADLLELGADHARLIREVYFALPMNSAELIGRALNAMRHDDEIAWTTVTYEMMQATGAEDEAADEVVRFMQRVAGVRALALFKERSNGTTKISLRSVAPINVAQLAKRWGGGGHAQASGATLMMPPPQAEAEVLPALRALVRDTQG
jgi:phosphoesterase RecJ-like protein